VRAEQLTLRVVFSGELDQLREYIALDPRFVPMESDIRDEPSDAARRATGQSVRGDEEEARQAFESLYQVLYYRWQPSPVIGSDGGE
jgi:hypothetical protein